MNSKKLQQAASDVKFLWCLDPVIGFHFFGILNFVALIVVNTFVFDENQLVWLVLLNCMVFLPVITAYFTSIATGTSNRVSRKRFFYACAVNNIGVIGILIGVLVILVTGGWYYDTSRQPEWAQFATIYKADLSQKHTAESDSTMAMDIAPMPPTVDPMIAVDEIMPIAEPISSDGAKVADIMPPYPYPPSYWVADWIKAVVLVVILAVILLMEYHTTKTMFSWFTTTPL